MKRFNYEATVERTVVDTITVSVDAADETEARKIVERGVQVYPDAITNDRIKYMYTENRQNIGINILDLEQIVENN